MFADSLRLLTEWMEYILAEEGEPDICDLDKVQYIYNSIKVDVDHTRYNVKFVDTLTQVIHNAFDQYVLLAENMDSNGSLDRIDALFENLKAQIRNLGFWVHDYDYDSSDDMSDDDSSEDDEMVDAGKCPFLNRIGKSEYDEKCTTCPLRKYIHQSDTEIDSDDSSSDDSDDEESGSDLKHFVHVVSEEDSDSSCEETIKFQHSQADFGDLD